MPGGPPTNGAALPLSTPEVPSSQPPGTIQPAVTELANTSIDPTMIVAPTPNTSACAESITMNLATPSTMAPANATGAAATPGVSPASPSGC
jgi:broad specificity polyphosphatase/5'/3'-nucleotidase SurE